MSRITVINKSRWPTPAIEIIAKWVARAAGITWDYKVTLSDRGHGWNGHGAKHFQRSYFARDFNRRRHGKPTIMPGLWPYSNKDHRFQWSENQTFRTRLELLVFLLAHEAVHATSGHPNEYREKGRTDKAGMEFHCDTRGYRIMQKFHEAWPTIRPLVYAAMRKSRDMKLRKAKARHDPFPKLALSQEHLTDWQRR